MMKNQNPKVQYSNIQIYHLELMEDYYMLDNMSYIHSINHQIYINQNHHYYYNIYILKINLFDIKKHRIIFIL